LSNTLKLSVDELQRQIISNDGDVSVLSAKLDRISAELSAELSACELSVNGLSIEVKRISAELSTDLSVLENRYDRTFDEMFYSRGTVGHDLSVDVLNIVDKEETDNQFTLQFLSGTLVLVKKTI